jgi:hypothetical protein
MNIPEPSAARQALLDVAGPEQYEKFLAELNGRCQSKQRLLYWQEVLWNRAQEQLGTQISDFQVIAALFRHCHVHGQDLEPQVVPVVYGTRQLTGSYIEAMESSFPYANEVFLGPCWREAPTSREVFYCQACREATARWEALGGA